MLALTERNNYISIKLTWLVHVWHNCRGGNVATSQCQWPGFELCEFSESFFFFSIQLEWIINENWKHEWSSLARIQHLTYCWHLIKECATVETVYSVGVTAYMHSKHTISLNILSEQRNIDLDGQSDFVSLLTNFPQ